MNQAALNRRRSMLRRLLNLLDHSILGRIVGSVSCVVGLLCYALSSSFKSLFGEWNPTKIVLHIILISIIIVIVLFEVVVLFEAKSRVSFVSKLKPHVQFLVLMLTSLYSFFADRYTKGRPDTWSVVSSVAFALASLCLSRQIKPGFDVGLFGFFLGRVTVQLMKIHLIFVLVAAAFCYPLVVLRSYSESQSENGESSAPELKEIRIDNTKASFGIGQDKAGEISPRRQLITPSPSPPPSTRLTQEDDRSARGHSGGSSFSSNDPLFARLPAHGNKSFEKLPEVAATEQFLSDLQEREKKQQQEQWEQEWELQGEQQWEQHQLQGEQHQLQHREQQQLQQRERQLQLKERQLQLRERRLQSRERRQEEKREPVQQERPQQEPREQLQRQWRLQREQRRLQRELQRELRELSGSSGSPAAAAVGASVAALCV